MNTPLRFSFVLSKATTYRLIALWGLFCSMAALPQDTAEANPETAASGRTRLVLHDCHIRTPGYPVSVAAQCGRLSVPEDRSQPDNGRGRRIELNIARVPSKKANPQKDPVRNAMLFWSTSAVPASPIR